MFSQLRNYLETKKYTLVNLSRMPDQNMLLKYYDELKDQPNKVLYIEKNESNHVLFKGENATGTNLLLFNKTSYSFYVISDFDTHIMDDKFKRNIDMFLNLSDKKKECNICFETKEYVYYCNTCSYGVCKKCGESMGNHNNNVMEIKCPQCRTEIILNRKTK
jgi:hypothetical protein